MALFEEYKNHPDPYIREKATDRAIAIGLQRVDSLNVSDFLIQIARQEIEGKITIFFCDFYMDLHYINSVGKVRRS